MPDIYKTINGLTCLGGNEAWKPCSSCPYHGKGLKPCRVAVMEDAIQQLTLYAELLCERRKGEHGNETGQDHILP